MQFTVYHRGIENDCTHLAEIERARKKHFIPRGRTRGIGLRGFLIKSDARRSVSNGNMHVRPRDFAGGVRPAPFVKRGCDSITMEFIHPSIYPVARRWATTRRESGDGKKFFLFLLFLPLPWTCIVIKKTRSELAIRFRTRFAGRELSGENFPREPQCHLSWHPVNIFKYSITYPKILSSCFHGIF